ncbi:MAG: hypothetical protein ACFB6R_14150 [Alphaproteobacteria bacterium]
MAAYDTERTDPGGWTAGRVLALEYGLVVLGILVALAGAASTLRVDVRGPVDGPNAGATDRGPWK